MHQSLRCISTPDISMIICASPMRMINAVLIRSSRYMTPGTEARQLIRHQPARAV
jgi:hypothetical protein